VKLGADTYTSFQQLIALQDFVVSFSYNQRMIPIRSSLNKMTAPSLNDTFFLFANVNFVPDRYEEVSFISLQVTGSLGRTPMNTHQFTKPRLPFFFLLSFLSSLFFFLLN
jgi:hypothetical protein